jgi:hypothetical protein
MSEEGNQLLVELEKILIHEIEIFKNILQLETEKKEIIIQSNGKELEKSTKNIHHFLTDASNIEKERIHILTNLYKSKGIDIQQSPSLTELLEFLLEGERKPFEKIASELREIISSLREKIAVNEKLLRAKQDIFQLSMEALKAASGILQQDNSYEAPQNKINRSRTSIMINAKA